MQRYELKEDKWGEYVKFEDHEAKLMELEREKDAEIAELANRVNGLEDEILELKRELRSGRNAIID